MKSAIVESGAYARPRAAPLLDAETGPANSSRHARRPARLFALLLWRSALCQAEANRDGDKWREKFASSDVSAGSSYTVTRLTPGIAYYFIVGRKEGDDITLGNFATPCGERVHVYSVGPPCVRGFVALVDRDGLRRYTQASFLPWPRFLHLAPDISAALLSAFVSYPQLRHLNTAWLTRLPASTDPQSEHRWLVW